MENSTERYLSYRWVVLGVATLAQASAAFSFVGVGTLAGFFREEFGLSGTQTGLIITAVGLVPLFMLVPVGRLLDRRGERGIVGGGSLLLAAGVGAAALALTYPMLLLFLVFGGAGYATSQPGGSKAVASWFAARRRGLAMGIRQSGLPLGGAAAAASLPALAAISSWRTALLTAGGVTAAGGLLFALLYRPTGRSPSIRYRLLAQSRDLIAIPRLRPVLWTGLVMVSAQFCIISYLMLFLRDAHGFSLTRGAWFLFAAQIGGIAGRMTLAAWSDELGTARRLWPVAVSMMSAGLCLSVLPVLPRGTGNGLLALLAVILGFFAFGWYGPWVVHVAEVAPAGVVGLTLGIAMTANQLGIAGAPPLFGLLLDLSGTYLVPWWILAALVLTVALRVGASIRRYQE